MLELSERDGWIIFSVRVVPRASRTEIVGLLDGALKIRIAAPPVDGAANEELIRGLAKALGIPPREVGIVRGQTGKSKQIRVPAACRTQLMALTG
ncbi:MAG: DUF167 domain-containing protein [Pyrinomonadaceae bacterium]